MLKQPDEQREQEPPVKETAKKAKAQKPAPEPTPEPTVDASPPEAEPAVSLVDVRAKLIELKEAGKGPQVQAILSAMGFANLTSVPADKYADLLAKAKELA
jgi:outer membrane biosynthesis protein TonB